MATSPSPQKTDFSVDFLGRDVCNGLDEALQSADRTRRADARPFDFIVIGGGSFGPVFAQHLFFIDKKHTHRILVLEAGPLALPEHVQNLPMIDSLPVWSTPWQAPIGFPGLAFCLGGRSIFWGGWSPQLLDEEMPRDRWPPAVREDLTKRFFREAAEQIGTDVSNDFIYGPLHEVLRRQLFDGINGGKVPNALPLQKQEHNPFAAKIQAEVDVGKAQVMLGYSAAARDLKKEDLDALAKLEAPLAIQAKARPGLFPFNKFSALPLLVKATREAFAESGGDDVKKRLMVVPNCHVKRLRTRDGRVAAVETNLGEVEVPAAGKVVLALGTIENARLALLSFADVPNAALIGRNLMAHLRSNLTIRIPRESLPPCRLTDELQVSAYLNSA